MTTIDTALLLGVHGGQTDAAPATTDNSANEAIIGRWQTDGIRAAHCSNLDFAASQFGGTPAAAAPLTAAADKCWTDLRQGMLNGE
jgi:hypothetical protein